MQLVKTFPPQVKEWKHLGVATFSVKCETLPEEYSFILSSPENTKEKDCIYFDVDISKKIMNLVNRKYPFIGHIRYRYLIKNKNETPTPEFCFSLVKDAASNYAVYLHNLTRKTNLAGIKINKADFEVLKNDLATAIENWKNNHS